MSTFIISIGGLCFVISFGFVVSFYIFIPSTIQSSYDRNDPIHIQWRSIVSIFYCILLILICHTIIVPILLVRQQQQQQYHDDNTTTNMNTITYTTTNPNSEPIQLLLLTTTIYENVIATIQILYHISLLYFGSSVQCYYELNTIVQRHIDAKVTTNTTTKTTTITSNKKDDDVNNNNNNYNNTVQNKIQQQLVRWKQLLVLGYTIHLQSIIRSFGIDQILPYLRQKVVLATTTSASSTTTSTNATAASNNPYIIIERWIHIRNYIIAPITEEIIFRYIIVSLIRYYYYYYYANSTTTTTTTTNVVVQRICWISPLFFGFAHIHNSIIQIYKVYRSDPSEGGNTRQQQQQQQQQQQYENKKKQQQQQQEIIRILLSCIFQILYTTIFGAYVTYVYIQSFSVVAIIIGHSYCNYRGLPNINGILNLCHPTTIIQQQQQHHHRHPNNQSTTKVSLLHRVHNYITSEFCIVITSYLLGIVLFYNGFYYLW